MKLLSYAISMSSIGFAFILFSGIGPPKWWHYAAFTGLAINAVAALTLAILFS